MIYRITVDYSGIKKYPCTDRDLWWPHLPHFWYCPERMRRFFCRGYGDHVPHSTP